MSVSRAASRPTPHPGIRSLARFAGLAAVAGALVTVLVVPLALVASGGVSAGVGAFDSLPSYLAITAPAQVSSIYAKSGGSEIRIATFYTENRTDVASSQISDTVKEAAVAAEDPRFYSEGAIDVTGTIRGILATTLGGHVEGGSSITQQYVKNVLVERCATENTDATAAEKCYEQVTAVTPARKLREMRYAISVEKKYSKDEILRGYLNIVGFGGNVYGIEAAAKYYFGTTAAQLTLAQAATLIAIINNPANLRIDEPADAANGAANRYALTLARRDYVLDRMQVHGMITAAEDAAAKATPITPAITPMTSGCQAATADDAAYFCDYVVDVVRNDPAFGKTADERLANLEKGGYKIYTSLDLDLQKTAQASLSAYAPATTPGIDFGATNVSVEPGTGRIVTMVQNTAYTASGAATPGVTGVNYNTDEAYGGSTGFQTGSAYKAFDLAAWLEAGHTLNDTVSTSQHSFPFSDFTNSCVDIGDGVWSTTNAESAPARMTVLKATAESINTAFADMATQLDLCSIRNAAAGLLVHPATTGASLASNPASVIGTNTIAPLTMATAYAGIANGGVVCTPVAIDSITDGSGKAIATTPTTCTQGMASDIAAGVATALTTVLQPGGTGASANPDDGVPILAKTGTSDNAEQNWLVTSTTKIATATWVGNVTGSVDFYDASVGGIEAANIKFDIAKPILQALDARYGGGALATAPVSEIGGSYRG